MGPGDVGLDYTHNTIQAASAVRVPLIDDPWTWTRLDTGAGVASARPETKRHKQICGKSRLAGLSYNTGMSSSQAASASVLSIQVIRESEDNHSYGHGARRKTALSSPATRRRSRFCTLDPRCTCKGSGMWLLARLYPVSAGHSFPLLKLRPQIDCRVWRLHCPSYALPPADISNTSNAPSHSDIANVSCDDGAFSHVFVRCLLDRQCPSARMHCFYMAQAANSKPNTPALCAAKC